MARSPVRTSCGRKLNARPGGTLDLHVVPFCAVTFPLTLPAPRRNTAMSRLGHSLLLAALLASPAAAQNLDSLLARMTLEEKLGQLNLLSAGGRASPAQMQLVRAGKLGGLFNVMGAENTTPVQRIAVTESRLKIPLLFGLDVIHGYRAIFPIPLAEAGSFDPEAAEATARAAGQEAAAFGINWTYAPMVDIARDPRWGRIAEGSGEDPYLGSLMAAARVRGFQQNIFATVKHFAGYGAAEAGREYNETEISERTMREVYLPPFKAAVDAGVASLMSAFNDIAGVPASANAWLTDTVLRREWKFPGFVVSDWTSVAELINHGVAGASIVLLKNERSLLPLDKAGSIAVIGPLADNKEEPLGPWHTQGRAEDVVSVLQGIKTKVQTVLYAQGSGIDDTSKAGFAAAVAAARQAKVAVLVLGERGDMSGEAASRASLGLPGVQQQLLEAVAATGTPVVLVLMNGRPLILEWASDHVPAIVETWFLGIEAGNATADVLFGDVNPSARLPVTFPRVLGQVPLYYNHRNTGRPPDANNKFTSKYIDVPVTPRYPFGYGLSYTTFGYSNLKLSAARARVSDTITATVTVTNSGSREGTEVVQLYVRDEVASVSRPVRELKAFRRVTLKPGESRAVELRVALKDLWFIGLDMKPVVEPGTFRVFVGANSADGQEATFECIP